MIKITLIICLDKKNGLSFNKRRQSRDSKVIERICGLANNSKLHIAEYSKSLFTLPCSYINLCDNPLKVAVKNEFYFLEKEFDKSILKIIEKIIVYRWNKVYPQDVSFDIDLQTWKLVSTENFIGSSHDMVTEEVYIK